MAPLLCHWWWQQLTQKELASWSDYDENAWFVTHLLPVSWCWPCTEINPSIMLVNEARSEGVLCLLYWGYDHQGTMRKTVHGSHLGHSTSEKRLESCTLQIDKEWQSLQQIEQGSCHSSRCHFEHKWSFYKVQTSKDHNIAQREHLSHPQTNLNFVAH